MNISKVAAWGVFLAFSAISAHAGEEVSPSSSEREYGPGHYCRNFYVGMKFEQEGITREQYVVESFNPALPIMMKVKSLKSGVSMEMPCEIVSVNDVIQ